MRFPLSASLLSISLMTLGLSCAQGAARVLIESTAEPAGEHCAEGGVRLDVGLDSNGDGVLDEAEIDSSQFVCNGTDGTDGTNGTDGTDGTDGTGTGDLIALSDEPGGVNCSSGGTRVDSGPDTNDNQILDSAEITSTQYICDGDPAQIVQVFDPAAVFLADSSNATAQVASIDVPSAGTLFAIAEVDAFCTAAGGTDQDCAAGVPASDLCLHLTTDSTAAACSFSNKAFAWLEADSTTSVSRSQVFDVAAGTSTIYLRAATTDTASSGEVGLWRRQLTLIFIPE